MSIAAKFFAFLVLFTRGAFAVRAYFQSRRDTSDREAELAERKECASGDVRKVDALDDDWVDEQW